MNTATLKPSELVSVLITAIKAGFNMLVQGAPGIGKTDLIKEAAKTEKADLMIEHAVTSDPTDYKGLGFPSEDRKSADFLPFGSLKTMIEAKKPLVVFFDDVGQAPQAVQAAIMQLILERRINGHKISDKVKFLAATNRKQDNAAVSGLITPLISRFASVVELEVSASDWINWGLKNQMPVELLSFLRMKPNLISTFDPSKRELKNFACPRTIANLGKWFNAGCFDSRVWAGCVGDAFATEFAAFYDALKTLGTLPDRICQGHKVDMPNRPDMKFAVCAALAWRASDVNWSNIMKFSETLPPEYQNFLVTDSTARKPELMNTGEYIAFAARNQNVL